MPSVVATLTTPAAVKRPFVSTVNVGISVCEPYDPAETPVSASVKAISESDPPLKVCEPVPSPDIERVRVVCKIVAELALPTNSP